MKKKYENIPFKLSRKKKHFPPPKDKEDEKSLKVAVEMTNVNYIFPSQTFLITERKKSRRANREEKTKEKKAFFEK